MYTKYFKIIKYRRELERKKKQTENEIIHCVREQRDSLTVY